MIGTRRPVVPCPRGVAQFAVDSREPPVQGLLVRRERPRDPRHRPSTLKSQPEQVPIFSRQLLHGGADTLVQRLSLPLVDLVFRRRLGRRDRALHLIQRAEERPRPAHAQPAADPLEIETALGDAVILPQHLAGLLERQTIPKHQSLQTDGRSAEASRLR